MIKCLMYWLVGARLFGLEECWVDDTVLDLRCFLLGSQQVDTGKVIENIRVLSARYNVYRLPYTWLIR